MEITIILVAFISLAYGSMLAYQITYVCSMAVVGSIDIFFSEMD